MLNAAVLGHSPSVQGMILHSELSRRRIRSIKKLIRVGKLEVVQVLRVDQQKGTWADHTQILFSQTCIRRTNSLSWLSISLCAGYIDLSKRRVLPEDVEKCEERYNQAKAVRHPSIHHPLPFKIHTSPFQNAWTGGRRGCCVILAAEALVSPLCTCGLFGLNPGAQRAPPRGADARPMARGPLQAGTKHTPQQFDQTCERAMGERVTDTDILSWCGQRGLQVGWPLYKSKYKHAYKAFEALMKGDDIFKEANITVRPSTHASTLFC